MTHEAGPPNGVIEAVRGVGAGLARVNSYGWRTLARKPTPHDFEQALLQTHEACIAPVLLLEYEGSYQFLDPAQPIGSYADWFEAGQVFARRFRPNGEFWTSKGIRDWGATVFTAINEPDVQASIPVADYRAALAGLADGVHSIDPKLRVVPGGFATCNSHGDETLRGYAPAIADLINDGRLDGIDLHTYYHPDWFPFDTIRFNSAQSCFDRVKAAAGITRADVRFYATEFNVAKVGAWAEDHVAARLFLTAIWDNLSVVASDGATPATVLAFPWNLADTGRIEGPQYAMASREQPWAPSARGEVLQRVLALAGNMRPVSLDPKGSGMHVFEAAGRRLYVWQNLPGWTDRPGPDWTVEVPEGLRHAELWGWDGLRSRQPVRDGKVHIGNLAVGETYMLLVTRDERGR